MAKLVVLVTLVAMATAGSVIPNRPHAAYPAYGKDYRYDDYRYPNYKQAAPYPARKDYVYAPAKVTRNAYDSPYGKVGYDYKPVYPTNNYDYKYRPAVATPVKRVADPYSYYNDYRANDPYGYQPVKKVVHPFQSKAILPARKRFDPFSSKPVSTYQDAYPYNFGVQKNVYPAPSKAVFPAAPAKSVIPVKRVRDPYPYSYQPNYQVRKVVDPYPANAVVYPAYPVKRVADPYYPNKAGYPARNAVNPYAYDPYYSGSKRAVPAKTVATPVVKKAVPAKSRSIFGSFPSFGDFGKGFGKDLFPNFKF